MSRHTTEPWQVVESTMGQPIATDSIPLVGAPFVGQCPLTGTCPDYPHNVRRAVACVNACAGVDDPAKTLEAARYFIAQIAAIRDPDACNWTALTSRAESLYRALGGQQP